MKEEDGTCRNMRSVQCSADADVRGPLCETRRVSPMSLRSPAGGDQNGALLRFRFTAKQLNYFYTHGFGF